MAVCIRILRIPLSKSAKAIFEFREWRLPAVGTDVQKAVFQQFFVKHPAVAEGSVIARIVNGDIHAMWSNGDGEPALSEIENIRFLLSLTERLDQCVVQYFNLNS